METTMRRLAMVAVVVLAACGGHQNDPPPPAEIVPHAPVAATWTVSGNRVYCPGADYSGPDEAQWLCRWSCGILPGEAQPLDVYVWFCDYGGGVRDVCMSGGYVSRYCL